ncbi:peptidase C15, pyroglutamyl peptidase I-like protein [Teratosphaeria nubilosa]|uniref:Peptidase C15, pyroglutamyl peptidase I-like protein n=1 Tax=Teratosphaeria nubilosa TaxID=161662 RepID=A0A6G1LLA3_9PEZI|nr:peptidase C15, pyroglutamyl peptidase I-like protein [Teratosphaeria nubilosa]
MPIQHPVANGDSSIRNDDGGKVITILVTGFGPFQEKFPVNPSYEIARSLPQTLPRGRHDKATIHIIGYASPIRVCYEDARKLLPPLLESYGKTVDVVLHIGMASGRQYYTAERYGHRDGYARNKDVDGRLPPYDEPQAVFGDCPTKMETSLDFDDVVKKWQSAVLQIPDASPAHGAVCRPSEDAGRFLCDYTYFNSLAWYGRRSGKLEGGERNDRPVLFLHVPAESDEVGLERGRGVAIALVRAMVESYLASGELRGCSETNSEMCARHVTLSCP